MLFPVNDLMIHSFNKYLQDTTLRSGEMNSEQTINRSCPHELTLESSPNKILYNEHKKTLYSHNQFFCTTCVPNNHHAVQKSHNKNQKT